MVAIAIWPVLIALVGVLMYALSSNGKVQEIGRIMFFDGLLVVLFVVASNTVRIP